MTKEELKLEALKYLENFKDCANCKHRWGDCADELDEDCLINNCYSATPKEQDIYIAGAEFAYNKANEWHYVKDGLPKDNEYVLIYTDLNNCYVAKKVENHFMSKGWGFIPMSTVIAWKEIVLPELPKENE